MTAMTTIGKVTATVPANLVWVLIDVSDVTCDEGESESYLELQAASESLEEGKAAELSLSFQGWWNAIDEMEREYDDDHWELLEGAELKKAKGKRAAFRRSLNGLYKELRALNVGV